MEHKKLILPLLEWFSQAARDLPWRRTRDPYAIWVSEIMLQQTQVKTVLPYFERWMKALPDIRTLARASSETIHKLWEGLGYYTRVRNMQQAAQVIVRKHAGSFPREFEAVLALPGIGRYTAGAVCSIAFNQPHPILDGNVIRVLTRWFGIRGDPKAKKTNARLWALAGDLVHEAVSASSPPHHDEHEHSPFAGNESAGRVATLSRLRSVAAVPSPSPLLEERAGERRSMNVSRFNQSLMELGALICTPKQPKCSQCPIALGCIARRQGRTQELPNLPRRAPATPRRFVAFLVGQRGRFLVRQRPAGVVNAQLWEFPNVEVGANGFDARRAARTVLGATPTASARLCVIKHSITRYRITLEAFRVTGRFGQRPGEARSRWLNHRELNKLPFTSAHRKILNRLALSKS